MLLGGRCNTIFLTPTFLHLALCHKTKFSKYVFIKINATMKGKFNSWLFDAIFFLKFEKIHPSPVSHIIAKKYNNLLKTFMHRFNYDCFGFKTIREDRFFRRYHNYCILVKSIPYQFKKRYKDFDDYFLIFFFNRHLLFI